MFVVCNYFFLKHMTRTLPNTCVCTVLRVFSKHEKTLPRESIWESETNAKRQPGGMIFEDFVWEGNILMGAVNVVDVILWLEWLDLQRIKRCIKNKMPFLIR